MFVNGEIVQNSVHKLWDCAEQCSKVWYCTEHCSQTVKWRSTVFVDRI